MTLFAMNSIMSLLLKDGIFDNKVPKQEGQLYNSSLTVTVYDNQQETFI
uniref:Uncharacterized protein n=1 Tax=Anguilla anguilla TaxID=7936 RepID=A0A0E9X3X5_ANGAN